MSAVLYLLSATCLLLLWLQTPGVEGGGACDVGDIRVYQASTGYGAGHVPEFTVQILNASPTNTPIRNIHVACGEFASARLVNPHVFRRLQPGDCLVKDGDVVAGGELISFVYTNSGPYKLDVSHVEC